MVRGRHRIPFGNQGVGQSLRSTRRLEAFLGKSGCRDLLLPGQGQHPVPHPHLARHAHGIRRTKPPTDVAANEYLNFKGQEFSKSRNWAVWLPDYLERYEVDPLRYYLASTMPEPSDSDFTWEGFVAANNNELVATFGNFVHRVLTLTYRNFDGKIPEPGISFRS